MTEFGLCDLSIVVGLGKFRSQEGCATIIGDGIFISAKLSVYKSRVR